MTDLFDRVKAALADRYAVERRLGAGGMAIVYLARDLRHGREVAIKVLRPELAQSLGSERFLRETEIAARLTHPHILVLLESGEADGLLYYVMPYLPGETLRERLQREIQLPVGEALRIAREVADALSYAHDQGLVHRDIKPENILFEAGHAVVSDFGIARALSSAGGERLTETGLAVGTPAYMSPEQASGGREVDGRSDIYALGAVLYEMLTGEPPFQGATAQAIMAKRFTAPIPHAADLRDTVPRSLDRAVTTALARVPADRFPNARKFIEALELPPDLRSRPRLDRRAIVAGTLVLLVTGTLAGVLLIDGHQGANAAEPGSLASGFAKRLVPFTFEEGVEEWPAWSPDGEELVYAGEVEGYKKLVVKALASGSTRQLTTGPRDDIQPAWSPDGRRIAFVRSNAAGGKLEPTDVFDWYQDTGDLWLVDARTGEERQLVRGAFNPAWSPDGTRLAFDARWAGPVRLWVTDSGGRNPEQITTDSSEAVVHESPQWSPDGKRLAFRRIQKTKSDILVVDLTTKATSWITDDNVIDLDPVWSASGDGIYFSSSRGGGLNVWQVPVSHSGQAAGPARQLTTGAGNDVEVAVAPDGRRLAFAVIGINSDLWRLPVSPKNARPTGEPGPIIATTRVESRGAWSPDGKTVAFNSDRQGEMNIWLHDLAAGSDRQLTSGPGGDYQANWSPDGTAIAFFSARSGNNDIWIARVADGTLTRLTTEGSIDINPFFSPDGGEIAFHSDRNGRFEAWVMHADGSGQRRLASLGVGGHFMRWSSDGQSLVLRAEVGGATQMFEVAVAAGETTRLPDVGSGGHISFSPDRSLILDVRNHKQLWAHPGNGAPPYPVFGFSDPDVRIDYPVWSQNGAWVLFDRAAPRGGDIWLLEGGR